MKGIKISEKHGLNPTLLVCPICHQETGRLALLGKLKEDAEAPKYSMDINPCPDCQKHLDEGHRILIEVKDCKNRSGKEEPQRTGRLLYLTNPKAAPSWIAKVAYIEESTVKQIFSNDGRTGEPAGM